MKVDFDLKGMKIPFLSIALIFILLLPSSVFSFTAEIECDYFSSHFSYIGSSFMCNVVNSPVITEDDTILKVTNENSIAKNLAVQVFVAENKKMQFLPQEMHFVFGKLRGIQVINCGLQQLRQKDLINYPHLEYLNLKGNQIEILTADVFKSNLNLKFISLRNNLLSKISPSGLEILNNVEHIWLSGNPCSFQDTQYHPDVALLITKVRNTCSTDEENPKLCEAAADAENERMKREIIEKDFRIKLLEFDIGVLRKTRAQPSGLTINEK